MERSEPYEFLSAQDSNHTYIFTTLHGLRYEIRFTPSGYLFDNQKPFSDYVYDMVIAVKGEKASPRDARIAATVSAVLLNFFERERTVLVYVCENADGRGPARNRKFEQWFDLSKNPSFTKIDFVFGSSEEPYLTTLIMKANNPYMADVVKAFQSLLSSYDKP